MNLFFPTQPDAPVLDVRSPAEYKQGHMPGAVNLPLFSNEERAEIGTLYKQQGKETAVLRGLEIVGPKMADFVRFANALSAEKKINLYCWRGGMRSGSMGWLFRQAGFQTEVLAGGYKAYRNRVLSDLNPQHEFHVVAGPTGSGKTEILQHLKAMGEQVLDLEALAGHRGSSYGGIGLPPQPTSEQFENNLHHQWLQLDLTRRVWVEDESKTIGKCYVPLGFWHKLREGNYYLIQPSTESRIRYLVQMYGNLPRTELAEATFRLQKRLGGDAVNKALAALENNNLEELVKIVLYYYDKAYQFGLNSHPVNARTVFTTDEVNPEAIANSIIKTLSSNNT